MAKTFRYKINNTFQFFDEIIYISTDGNDLNGNGTKLKPYKTIKKATSMVAKNNTAIVLQPGQYNERVNDYGNNTNCGKNSLFSSNQYTISFIGSGKDTIINTEFNKTNCSVIAVGQSNFTVQNLIVKINCTYTGDNASNCFFAGNPTYDTTATINNCVFEFLQSGNQKGIYYDNIRGRINLNNCSIYMGDVANSWAGIKVSTATTTMLTATNCIFRDLMDWRSFGGGTIPPRFSLTCCIRNTVNFWNQYNTMTDGGGNIIFDVISDSLYYPNNTDVWVNSGISTQTNSDNSRSNIGVYGGIFQWSNSKSVPINLAIENPYNEITKGTNIPLRFNIDTSYVQNSYYEGIAQVQSFNDNTNITYLYNVDQSIWYYINKIEIW